MFKTFVVEIYLCWEYHLEFRHHFRYIIVTTTNSWIRDREFSNSRIFQNLPNSNLKRKISIGIQGFADNLVFVRVFISVRIILNVVKFNFYEIFNFCLDFDFCSAEN